MNVLVILGHPRTESFSGAIADAYAAGAGVVVDEVRQLRLADLAFDRDVKTESPAEQALEPDLVRAQELICWADHLAFVYPNWWGTMPALLKAFFDRVFTPGFAFSFYEHGEGAGHEKLLDGRTAELLVTMDMPWWVYRLIYRRPGTTAIRRSTLGFAGIRTTNVTAFGPVEDSDPAQRQRWLDRARERGRKLADGPDSRVGRLKRRLGTALQALRLQFYPMAWLAYTIGALAAADSSGVLRTEGFWLGLGFLFWLEAATVLTNDYFDYESDRRNTFAGPFTGGSRVLVDGGVEPSRFRWGVATALVLTTGFAVAVLARGVGDLGQMAGLIAVMTVLALGYTVPPLQLSYRTLGELDVAVTHSLGVVLCGYVFVGGSVGSLTPWLVSTPLLLAIIPSITLAGVPDTAADRAVGKRTIAVRFGTRGVLLVVVLATLASSMLALGLYLLSFLPTAYCWPIVPSAIHAIGIIGYASVGLRSVSVPRRVDRLMVLSLSYVAWFAVVPIYCLL